jgi:hypothetical protein
MGIIWKSPRKNTALTTALAKVRRARSQSLLAICTATGARVRPMTTMTGPVTTGGKTRRTFSEPMRRTRRAKRP